MSARLAPATSLSVGNESADKPLRPFGSASVRKMVAEGRAMAERDDVLHERRQRGRG